MLRDNRQEISKVNETTTESKKQNLYQHKYQKNIFRHIIMKTKDEEKTWKRSITYRRTKIKIAAFHQKPFKMENNRATSLKY